ncbi:MAG: DUF4062 domain-containing protein [Bacteroidales bacterium]|nr:DUF4062 domain-containing protein [Bacteroidales bacterium]
MKKRMFSFMRRKKVLFLISLPQTEEFLSCSDNVKTCIQKLRNIGVDCFEEINPRLLSKANKYDVVIVVAHRDDNNDALALANGQLTINDFVNSFPSSFDGVIDFSSCYSATAMDRIKQRCPDSKVQTSLGQTTLAIRLAIYPYIIELLNKEKNRPYNEVYKEVLDAAVEDLALSPGQHPVKLGKHMSSVYSPSTVERQKPFLVQIFFHSDSESQSVDIQARRIDPNTGLIESQTLPLKLKNKDIVSVRFDVVSPHKQFVKIEDEVDTKNIIWLGQTTKLTFCVNVDAGFPDESFIGKLMIEVNSIPIGECYFAVKVANSEQVAPADVSVKEHDFEKEYDMAHNACLGHFKNSLSRIENKINGNTDDAEREKLEHLKKMYSNCIDLIENNAPKKNNRIKKVFVSSTSDMKPYREVVRQEIEGCDMFPEMYENWPQTDATPRDECCKRVIDSDILLCILGSRYGFVDPDMDASMTEIEYLTALGAGKTILVFIIDPLNNSDEPHDLAERQKKLIGEIRDARILKYFSSKEELAKTTVRDLSRLSN